VEGPGVVTVTGPTGPDNLYQITYRVIDIYVSEENKNIYEENNFNTMYYMPTKRKFITVFYYKNKKINKKIQKQKHILNFISKY
jgi:hypothetical protein